MTQYERMVNGLIYDPGDQEIMAEQSTFQEGLREFWVIMSMPISI